MNEKRNLKKKCIYIKLLKYSQETETKSDIHVRMSREGAKNQERTKSMNVDENEWGIEWKNEWKKYVCNNNKIKICFNAFHKCGFLRQLASQSVMQPVKSLSRRLIPFIIQLREWVRFQGTVIYSNEFQRFSLEHKSIYYIWYIYIWKKKQRFSRTFSALFGLPTDYSWLLYIFGQFCVLAIVVGLCKYSSTEVEHWRAMEFEIISGGTERANEGI